MPSYSVDLKNIDVNKLHLLPLPLKLILSGVMLLFILVLSYFLIFSDQLDEWDAEKDKETQLKTEFSQKAYQAANLSVLELEIKELEKSFEILLKQLPTDDEVPNLIQELHQAASKNSLKLSSVVPEPAIDQESIQVLPYAIATQGSYEQITQFAKDVGELSRIIVLTNLDIVSANKSEVRLTAKARTYKAKDHLTEGANEQ